jgi:hypothetical protein
MRQLLSQTSLFNLFTLKNQNGIIIGRQHFTERLQQLILLQQFFLCVNFFIRKQGQVGGCINYKLSVAK